MQVMTVIVGHRLVVVIALQDAACHTAAVLTERTGEWSSAD